MARLADRLAGARVLLAVCGVLGGLIGVLQVKREPALYDSTAKVIVQGAGASHLTLVYAGSVHEQELNIASEGQILLSDTVLARVAKKLNLVNDRRFSAYARTGQVWSADRPEVRAALIAQLRAGLSVSDDAGPGVPGAGGSGQISLGSAGPQAMYMTFSGGDPTIGAAIVKCAIETYIERTFELRRDSMTRVAEQLSTSMGDFRQKVEVEQRALLEVERSSGLTGMSSQQNPDATELAALMQQSSQADARLRAARATGEVLADKAADLEPASSELDSLRTAAELAQTERAEAESTLGPRHPEVQGIDARTKELRRELAASEGRSRRQMAAETALAEREAELVDAEVRKQVERIKSSQNAGLAATTLQVQLARDSELYYVLVNNERTALLDAGYGSVTVEVLKEPDLPGRVRGKDFFRRAIGFALLGLAAGLALSFVRLPFQQTVAVSVERIGRELEMPCLAEVPATRTADVADSTSESGFRLAMEGFREAILLMPMASRVRRIAFTGGGGSQGTSMVAIGAAIALAKTGSRVLLIDADRRRPNIHRLLRLDGRSGVSTVLSGQARLTEAAIPLREAPGVDVLPAGPLPPKPPDSDALQSLLEDAERSYGYIVLDAGPAEAESEVAQVLDVADLAVLVVRQVWVNPRTLRRWGNVLGDSKVTLAGFVRAH